MKRIFIFIGLKISEIFGVFAILFGAGWCGKRIPWIADPMHFNRFGGLLYHMLVGVASIAILCLIFVVLVFIYDILEANWEWAGRIVGKK